MKTAVKSRRELPRKIAVPTDFSPGSTSAMACALALAGTDKKKVTAVHAVDPFEYNFGPKGLRYLKKKKEVWARAQEAMSDWLKANKFTGCAVSVIEGEAGPAIAQFIDQKSIDLTVLGTSARRHAARLLLGSVAEEIFRKANCLVLVLGPKMRIRRQQQLKRLAFATALEPHSLAALSRLSQLARKFDAKISVVRAVSPDIRSRTERIRITGETRLKIEAAVDPDLRKRIQKIHVEFGHPVKIITGFANRSKADAIVMGIRSGGEWDRATTHIPWAFAHRVIANAKCPVLTIRG
jgi:nucleotide-binding universal stress UspA family protein